MSHKKLVGDGFFRDEDGKWHLMPIKIPGSVKENGKKSDKKPARKFIHIERLKMPSFDDISPRESKRRKFDEKPIRKELFKVPQRKSKGDTGLAFSTRQSSSVGKSRLSYNKMSKQKKSYQPLGDGSPLLDIDEAEELLQKKRLDMIPPKAITIPNIIVTEGTINGETPAKNDFYQENKTPTSIESDNEFVQIEKTLAALNESKTESPMSSVCALLENAKINNSAGKSSKKRNGVILNEIITLIHKDKSEFETLSHQINALNVQFSQFARSHQQNYMTITNLLSQLEDGNNKENLRRSGRIAAQVTTAEEKSKFVVSPAISKKVDLRKTTLNKNLTKTLQTDIQSPRMKKAIDLYNTIRKDNGILSTPKLDRAAIEVQQTSVTRSLSRRIQKQCLLLQDTPRN